MQTSLKSAEHARLVATLVAVRHGSGIRQQALAKKLGRPQSLLPLNLLQLPALLMLIQSSCSGILLQESRPRLGARADGQRHAIFGQPRQKSPETARESGSVVITAGR